MAQISNIQLPDNNSYGIRAVAIPFGVVDSTSTATAFTVTVPGITELVDGVCCYVKNSVVTSASGFTLNVNGLGAKRVYNNMAAATAESTLFNVSYTFLFVYNSTRTSAGCWDLYRGYDSNTNTIGYQLRTNSTTMPVTGATYRYRLLFTSLNGQSWVPANTSTSTNATSSRTVNQTVIDPFGRIVYYGYTTALSSGSSPGATYLWDQYVVTLGYSFNRTNAALTLTINDPVYLKCSPQSGGGVIIDADTPYTQTLPTTDDGYVYIFLGIANAATTIELVPNHPVYYYKDGAIRLWTNPLEIPTKTSDLTNDSGFVTSSGVTSITAGTGLTGGTITSTGTIALDTTRALTSSDITTGTDEENKLVSAKTLSTVIGSLGGGTVTSVGITNGGGLSITGSPVTSSGSITVGHSNSVTAQTTQAVYPIKIDAYGHISAYGDAVTIPTVNDASLTVKSGTTTVGTFTANDSDDLTITFANSSITPVTSKTVVTSASGATASYSAGKLTLTNGSFGTGASVTTGTAVSVLTGVSSS